MQNEPLIFTAEKVRSALPRIASLLSKSAKALQQCPPGTWQNSMLTRNIKALQTASTLMRNEIGDVSACCRTDLEAARGPVVDMIEKTAKALDKSTPDTSQHTLLQNRIKALRIAAALIEQSARAPLA